MSIDAMTFAVKAHDGQMYGDQPCKVHLAAVVQVVADFGYDGEYIDAAWLHDVIEDTTATRGQIDRLFGSRVRQIVDACTGVGANRKERNACIYRRIANCPEAAVVKVADRIANVEASATGSSHRAMYVKERVAFSANVASKAPRQMEARLDRAYFA